jgi:UDP-glucose 4-epimerase
VPHAVVTGAGGFIGRPVVQQLTRLGVTVTSWTDPVDQLAGFRTSADVVIHLAASSRYSTPEAGGPFDLAANDAAMAYCRAHGASFVFASTAGVYGMATTPTQDEDSPIGPENPYAARKLEAERQLRDASDRHGISCTVLRLFNVYGPRQRPPFLVPYCIETLASDQPLELRMPGAIRDFVFVDDVARAFAAAARDHRAGFRVINIGSGHGTRVKDLVTMVAGILGRIPRWATTAGRAPEVPASVADISRAQADLQWAPEMPLYDGLKMTCAL